MSVSPARKYPAVFALAAIVLGILIAENLSVSSFTYLISALIFLGFSLLFYNRDKLFITSLGALLALAALSSFGYTFRLKTFSPGHIVHFIDDDKLHQVFGTITDWPILKGNRTEIYIHVDSLVDDGSMVRSRGRILLRIMTPTTRLQYGDRVIFETRLYSVKGGRNPSGLDYKRFLVLKEVFGIGYLPHQFAIQVDPVGEGNLRRLTGQLRLGIVAIFQRTLEPDAAALASGFLIGETRDISSRIYELFRDSGTLHLLAVSGSNVALVLMLFAFVLKASPFRVITRTVILLLVILIFSFLAYNQPSVVRASIMASLILLGKLLQKRIDYHNIIATTALLILLFKPTELFDIGFQLSFACAWGLVFFVPKVTVLFHSWRRKFLYRYLILPLVVCMIAEIVSIPLTGFYFHRMPLISFAANLVIVPLVGVIVIGEIVLLLVSFLIPIAGNFVGAFLNILLNLNIHLLEVFGSSNLNFPAGEFISVSGLVIYYLFIVLLAGALTSPRYRRTLIFFVLIVLNAAVIFKLTISQPDFRLTVFSIPNGIIAVEQSSPPRVILANMPRRDYSYAELVISPYLENSGMTTPEIIVLDADYQTVWEALTLTQAGYSRLYLPIEAEFLTYDLLAHYGMELEPEKTIFYSGQVDFDRRSESELTLGSGGAVYIMKEHRIIVAPNNNKIPIGAPGVGLGPNAILILPILDLPDGEILTSSYNPQIVICNKITKALQTDLQAVKMDPQRRLPQLYETSRLGSVEIILKKGLVTIEN